jgi:uncharacterized protein (TIGR02246 family)
MNRFSRSLLAIFSLVGCLQAVSAGERDADEAAIRQVQSDQAAAWNRHDAAAYSNLFTPEGDVVNVLGWWWTGRAQIQQRLENAFQFVFRDSLLTVTDTRVRFLSTDIAVAHVRWSMSGAKMPPGAPPPHEGIQLQVLRKQAGRWLIESFQNTNAIPEKQFPNGPPAPDKKS